MDASLLKIVLFVNLGEREGLWLVFTSAEHSVLIFNESLSSLGVQTVPRTFSASSLLPTSTCSFDISSSLIGAFDIHFFIRKPPVARTSLMSEVRSLASSTVQTESHISST